MRGASNDRAYVANLDVPTRVTDARWSVLCLAERRISGVYRTGDNAGFARAVAALHRLAVHERRDRLELAQGS
jgi:hypothetical protein